MLHTLRLLASAQGRSRASAASLRRLQEHPLRALVAHLRHHVPFHRRRLDAAGIGPGDPRTLDDAARIPTMTKALLRETPPAELVVLGAPLDRLDVVHTSGSTGAPLRIYRGQREVDAHRAAGLRILLEHGFRWTDRTLEIRVLFGPTFTAQRLGLAPKRWVSILYPPEAQLRALLEYRPQVLCASASTLHDLARAALDAAARPAPLRLVFSDAEPLVPATRDLVTRAFGTPPIDRYGLVELSDFAWECERRDGLHVSADTHLVEILGDDGLPVPSGEPGRIVCTDLIARTMPMLRYETGDRAALVVDVCPCGRTFPRLVGLAGRAADVVRLPDGRRLYWPWFHETFARLDDLERYQVIQETRDRLRVRVAAGPGRYHDVAGRIRAAIATVAPADLRIECETWDGLHDPREKFRPVVSRLPAEE
jgi:phenylacetate-CoA ligase